MGRTASKTLPQCRRITSCRKTPLWFHLANLKRKTQRDPTISKCTSQQTSTILTGIQKISSGIQNKIHSAWYPVKNYQVYKESGKYDLYKETNLFIENIPKLSLMAESPKTLNSYNCMQYFQKLETRNT